MHEVDPFLERVFAMGGNRFQTKLRAEAFSVLNHANFVGYSGTYGNGATAGPWVWTTADRHHQPTAGTFAAVFSRVLKARWACTAWGPDMSSDHVLTIVGSGVLAGPRGMDPVPDGKCAGDETQGDEDHHAPDERGRFGDAQNSGPEFDCQQAEHGKADGAGNEVDRGHSPQGIAERAGGGNDHGEGKRGRSQAADGNGHSRAIADSLLQFVELFLPGDFADAFLPELASDLGKQDHADSRAAGRGEDVEEESDMVMRDQANDEQIVSKGQYEEGRVEDAQDKRPKIAKVKQKMKQRAKPMRHERLFL